MAKFILALMVAVLIGLLVGVGIGYGKEGSLAPYYLGSAAAMFSFVVSYMLFQIVDYLKK